MRAFAASLLALCLGGCYLPFGIVEHYKPDPDRAKAVEIQGVVDGQVLLEDGRSVAISAVNLHLASEDQSMVHDLAEDQKKLLLQTHVLVRMDSVGKAELTAINHWRTEDRYEGVVCPLLAGLGSKYHTADVPIVILIPIIVDQNERWDVGQALLEKGLATTDARSNARYRAAQEKARKARVGIWMGPSERLVDLIQRDRPQEAAHMLQKGANPNAANGEGTALTHSISKGQYDLAGILLAKGADANLTARKGMEPPLLLACKAGNVELARRLVELGADVNKGTWWGHLPLHEAARVGNVVIVAFLLKHGAKIDAADTSGTTALGYAAESDRPEVAMLLVRQGADIRKHGSGERPLVYFARNGNLEMVKVLVEHGADLNSGHSDTPLGAAAAHGNIPVAQYLLAKGANINGRGAVTPLKAALIFHQDAMAEFLHAQGAKE